MMKRFLIVERRKIHSAANVYCNIKFSDEETKNTDVQPTEKIKKSKIRSYTSPRMSNNVIPHIHSFTSIHCGMLGLSWSTFILSPNEKTKVTHWGSKQLPESKLNLYDLAAFMTNAFKEIPKTDFYVFESPTAPNMASTSKTAFNLSQMVAMASVLAAQKNTLPIAAEDGVESTTLNIAYLRKFLFAR